MPTYQSPEIKEVFKYIDQKNGQPLFNTALSFVRMNKWPLDVYSLFRNLEEARNFIGNPDNPCYPGQIISTSNEDGKTGTAVPGSKADGKYRLYVVTKDSTKPNGLGLREFSGTEDAWRIVNYIPNYLNGTEVSTRILDSDISSGPITFAPGNDNISLAWNTNASLKNILRISSSDFKVETKNEPTTKFWITGVRQVLDSSITTNVFDPCIYVTDKPGEMVVPIMNSSVNNVSIAKISDASLQNLTVKNASLTNSYTVNSSVDNEYVKKQRVDDTTITNASITNSSLTYATIVNSSTQQSYIEDATIVNQEVTNSSITNGYVKNSSVLNSSVSNQSVTNLEVVNSSTQNSYVVNSEIVNSSVTYETVENSSIKKVHITDASITNQTVKNSSIENQFVTNQEVTNLDVTNASIDYIYALDISIGDYSLKQIAEQGPSFYLGASKSYDPMNENPTVSIENPNESLEDEYYIKSMKFDSSTLQWSDILGSEVPYVKGTNTYVAKGILDYIKSFDVIETEDLECVRRFNHDDSSAWYGDIIQSLWPIYVFGDSNKLMYNDITVGVVLCNNKGRCSNIVAIKIVPKCIGMLEDNTYDYKLKPFIY